MKVCVHIEDIYNRLFYAFTHFLLPFRLPNSPSLELSKCIQCKIRAFQLYIYLLRGYIVDSHSFFFFSNLESRDYVFFCYFLYSMKIKAKCLIRRGRTKQNKKHSSSGSSNNSKRWIVSSSHSTRDYWCCFLCMYYIHWHILWSDSRFQSFHNSSLIHIDYVNFIVYRVWCESIYIKDKWRARPKEIWRARWHRLNGGSIKMLTNLIIL